jgi:hypothetical protein
MRNFLRLAEGVDVLPLVHSLYRQPDLWKKDIRTKLEVFKDTEEIILRFFDYDETTDGDNPPDMMTLHFLNAWDRLPEAKPIIRDLMHRVSAASLERVFVSRLPPGGRILPHADTRGAYAALPDLMRYHIVLQGLPGSNFRCGEEWVHMKTGDVWSFNAREEHEVVNNSADDRIHLLADMRLM